MFKHKAAHAPAPAHAPQEPLEGCSSCNYVFSRSPGAYECHRYPPRPDPTTFDKSDTQRPTVGASDWCGEFKRS